MKEPRKQHLSEAVAGLISTIVKMMLGLLRARGLRGLLELPSLFRFVRDLRRLSEEFVTLFAAFKAGNRTPVAPAPETAPEPALPPAPIVPPRALPMPLSIVLAPLSQKNRPWPSCPRSPYSLRYRNVNYD